MSSMGLRIVLSCLVCFGRLRHASRPYHEVPKINRDDLASGQVVVLSRKTSRGVPWPKLQLYQVVNAPPKVVADLFIL